MALLGLTGMVSLSLYFLHFLSSCCFLFKFNYYFNSVLKSYNLNPGEITTQYADGTIY